MGPLYVASYELRLRKALDLCPPTLVDHDLKLTGGTKNVRRKGKGLRGYCSNGKSIYRAGSRPQR